MVKPKGNMVYFVIILIALLAGTGTLGGLRALVSYPAYMTGYQGAHMRYYRVRDQGIEYKEGLWDTTFKWDSPIAQDEHYKQGNTPPIAGEMTSVFIPSESLGYQPSWIVPEWLLGASRIKNPMDTYEWELKDGDETIFYRMELWRLKWYFSISSEPRDDGDISPFEGMISKPRNSLEDTEVWFEFDLTPMWYFNGTDRAYFAIASLRLTDIVFEAKVGGEEARESDERCRVTPQSKSSILPIYYNGFGGPRAEKEPFHFRGKELNPKLFRDTVYSYFTLNDFGVSAWWDWGWFWSSDVVTVGIDVDVFVIGEWKVKDIQDIPDEYGRSAKAGGVGLGLGGIILEFLSVPEGRFWLLIILSVIGLVVIAIAFPWVFIGLSSLFGARRSR